MIKQKFLQRAAIGLATIFTVKDKGTGKAVTVDTLDRTCEPAKDEA